MNEGLINYMIKKRIKYPLLVPHSPQQSGVAEKKNRYFIEIANCMLGDSKLNFKKMLGAAISASCYLQNRSHTNVCKKIPYEMLHGYKPYNI